MSKILVIEDEMHIRETVEELLTLKGYEVITAEDGQIGASMAAVQNPDLVLCDVNMPRMNGFETIKKIRKTPGTATVPCIFLTARTAGDDFREGMKSGADDYLFKPFSADDLFHSLERQFRKVELQQEEFDILIRQKIRNALEEYKLKESDENSQLKVMLADNLDDILHAISHVMRSPLVNMLGLMEALNSGEIDQDSLKKFASMFKGVTENMEKVTRELNETFSVKKEEIDRHLSKAG